MYVYMCIYMYLYAELWMYASRLFPTQLESTPVNKTC